MTHATEPLICAWCKQPIAEEGGPGIPPHICELPQPNPARTAARLKLEFDYGGAEEGPGEVFQTLVRYMGGLLVEVTPSNGKPKFHALIQDGQNPNPDGHDDEWLDEVRVHRVDDQGDPTGEPEYVRVRGLRIKV